MDLILVVLTACDSPAFEKETKYEPPAPDEERAEDLRRCSQMRTPILKAKGVFGDDLEIAEGEFVAVLSLDCESRRNLLSVLSQSPPPKKARSTSKDVSWEEAEPKRKRPCRKRVKLCPRVRFGGSLRLITDEGLVKVVLIDGRKSPWHVRESARTLDLIKSFFELEGNRSTIGDGDAFFSRQHDL